MIYKEISHVNWSVLTTKDGELKDLNIEGSFLVPQLLALVASQIPPIKVGDKYSFSATRLNLIEFAKAGMIKYSNGTTVSATEVHGIIKFLRAIPRGEVLGGAKQIDPKVSRYATGVPLILSAYREYKDIQYSEWDFNDEWVGFLVDKDILSILPYISNPPDYSAEQLLEYRTLGGTFKTGKNAGKVKHPNSITTINKVGDPDFDNLPKLLRLMLCQTWVFQPSIRSKYAITSISDIDSVAPDITGGIDLLKPAADVEEDTEWN
jgi:hypothetical protein